MKGFSRECHLIFKEFFLDFQGLFMTFKKESMIFKRKSSNLKFKASVFVECDTDYYYQASKNIWLKKLEILVRRNQTQSRFPEETNSCHLVIIFSSPALKKRGSSDVCLDIVNSVFVSEQYITYWIHFGYFPCRWNSDEEIWNISPKGKTLHL